MRRVRVTIEAMKGLRRWSWLAPTLGVMALAFLPAGGCGDDEGGGNGASCQGGIVQNGKCVAKCDASKCAPPEAMGTDAAYTCINNACALICNSHNDCFAGSQACAPRQDDAGQAVNACSPTGHVDRPGGGYGVGCPLFPDVDPCVQSFACPNGLECDPNACADCQLDAAACTAAGVPTEACNIGKCGDNTRCTFTTCDAAQCTPFVCLSSGEGDAEAYCTHHDCTDDNQCAPGFYCGYTRDPRDICGPSCDGGLCTGGDSSEQRAPTCTSDAQCQKGNNTLVCGLAPTGSTCFDFADSPPGTTFEEGSRCLLRRTCLKREECAPCSSDLDCSLGIATVCASFGEGEGAERFCARPCGAFEDCGADAECIDPDGGGPAGFVCTPRTGSCHAAQAPDPAHPFCQRCLHDVDCGGADSDYACVDVAALYGINMGQQVCLDLSFNRTCTSDADCEEAPSGAHGECMDEGEGVVPGDFLYRRCYAPTAPFSDFGNLPNCWPTPP
jgi:hypothetical protein